MNTGEFDTTFARSTVLNSVLVSDGFTAVRLRGNAVDGKVLVIANAEDSDRPVGIQIRETDDWSSSGARSTLTTLWTSGHGTQASTTVTPTKQYLEFQGVRGNGMFRHDLSSTTKFTRCTFDKTDLSFNHDNEDADYAAVSESNAVVFDGE